MRPDAPWQMQKENRVQLVALIVSLAIIALRCPANATEAPGTNSFPGPSEIFQGRTFTNKFERDVFFLREIRENYPMHWAPLLEANLTVTDYVLAPDKLLRFVEELGAATANTDDATAVTNLAAITTDPTFYANTNASRPEIESAAAVALMKIGPRGTRALVSSFSEVHYRTDSASLEVLADAIAKSGTADPKLTEALAATVFTFMATNGGSYPRCTREVTQSLLRLPDGATAVSNHLKPEEIFRDPGRYQAVVDGIAAARAVPLSTNLVDITSALASKAKQLTNSSGPYLDDLKELQMHVEQAIGQLNSIQR